MESGDKGVIAAATCQHAVRHDSLAIHPPFGATEPRISTALTKATTKPASVMAKCINECVILSRISLGESPRSNTAPLYGGRCRHLRSWFLEDTCIRCTSLWTGLLQRATNNLIQCLCPGRKDESLSATVQRRLCRPGLLPRQGTHRSIQGYIWHRLIPVSLHCYSRRREEHTTCASSCWHEVAARLFTAVSRLDPHSPNSTSNARCACPSAWCPCFNSVPTRFT